MIVQNDHEPCFGKNVNGIVKDLHGSFSVEFGVGLNQFVVDHVVFVKHLQWKGESDAVHVERIADLLCHVSKFSVLESADTVSFGVASRPVASSQFDAFAVGVDYFHAFGWERELNSLNIKQGGFRPEIFLQFIVFFQKIDSSVVILVTHYFQEAYWLSQY